MRVAGPVVHADRGAPRVELSEFPDCAAGINEQETGAGGQHIPTTDGRCRGADVAIDLCRDGAFEHPAGADPGPMQLRPENVDPEQLVTVGDPPEPLAEQPWGRRAGHHPR